MKRLALLALFGAACSNTVTTISSGQFASPVGLAATSAGDRDLLFIANSGKDGLIALQLCTHPLTDAGGIDPADTCDNNENAQFIPGPIRVFPGTIETAQRTVRVAGARLLLPDGGMPEGGPNGEALAVGVDSSIHVVDARSLVDAEHGIGSPTILLRPCTPDNDAGVCFGGPDPATIGGLGVDVVAANKLDPDTDLETAAASVKVFVATEEPAQLTVMTASLDANGHAQLPTRDASCVLDPVVPRKIAAIPGRDDMVYVADGAGDGVVSIAVASITDGAPCPMTRISAGGRSTRSVAVSPPWYETVIDHVDNVAVASSVAHPAGEILMMVVEPATDTQPGFPLDPGGVLFARTSDGALFPTPPFDWRETGHEAMQPLQPTGLAREAAFLRSIRPGPNCATSCTLLNFNTAEIGTFDLLAVVSSTDGSTTFIDVPNRRFPDPSLDQLSTFPTLLAPFPTAINTSGTGATPNVILISGENDPNGPNLTIDPNSTVAGVTHSSIWRAIWHSPIVGLSRRAGQLTVGPDPGTLTFLSPPANFDLWTQDPTVQLGPGDVVALGLWSSADPNCQSLVSAQNNVPQFSYELTILSISGSQVVLSDPSNLTGLGAGCTSAGAVAEFHVAGAQPWLVFNGPIEVGRTSTGATFVARETRWDYPFVSCAFESDVPCYDPNNPPSGANDQSFTFVINAAGASLTPGTGFTWSMANNQGNLTYGDPNNLSGYATAVLGYSSPRSESLVFTSLTGSNEIIQADPALMRADITGIQGYR